MSATRLTLTLYHVTRIILGGADCRELVQVCEREGEQDACWQQVRPRFEEGRQHRRRETVRRDTRYPPVI